MYFIFTSTLKGIYKKHAKKNQDGSLDLDEAKKAMRRAKRKERQQGKGKGKGGHHKHHDKNKE